MFTGILLFMPAVEVMPGGTLTLFSSKPALTSLLFLDWNFTLKSPFLYLIKGIK